MNNDLRDEILRLFCSQHVAVSRRGGQKGRRPRRVSVASTPPPDGAEIASLLSAARNDTKKQV